MSNHAKIVMKGKQTEWPRWRTLVCELSWWRHRTCRTTQHQLDVSYPCLWSTCSHKH